LSILVHLKKARTDTEIKFYKFVARPSLIYGNETWVTTKRDMTRLEAAEMRFLRSVTGYTRLDKIRNEVIRKELEISGIQDVRPRYKQNWNNHLETGSVIWPIIVIIFLYKLFSCDVKV